MLIECCYHKNPIEVENTFECGYCDECDLCPENCFNFDDGEEDTDYDDIDTLRR